MAEYRDREQDAGQNHSAPSVRDGSRGCRLSAMVVKSSRFRMRGGFIEHGARRSRVC